MSNADVRRLPSRTQQVSAVLPIEVARWPQSEECSNTYQRSYPSGYRGMLVLCTVLPSSAARHFEVEGGMTHHDRIPLNDLLVKEIKKVE